MSDVLFTITKDQLETGLRGFPVGYCSTSSVDPVKGLFYRGIPLSEVDSWQPEEVIYLLYEEKKGSREEVKRFSDDLQARASLPAELTAQIRSLPRTLSPMKLFAAALLMAQGFDSSCSYREQGLNIVARAPNIAATVIAHHAGLAELVPSDPSKGYMGNFAHRLGLPGLTQAFSLFNILHYDHGGGNLSAFVGKAIASGLEDMYGSLAGAMCALEGSRHGKANQDCLAFLEELQKKVGSPFTEEKLESVLRDKLEKKELLFGFGHAVLRVEDPRATRLYALCESLYPDHPLVKQALILRRVGTKILQEQGKVADPFPNVDAISGVFLTAAGFPDSIYYTVLFGLARVVGISRQIIYEREEAREGRGTPIVRPRYLYRT